MAEDTGSASLSTRALTWVGGAVLIGVVLGGIFFFYWPTTPATEPGVQGASTVSTAGWLVYSDMTHGFSIMYPPDFKTNAGYRYTARGPGKDIQGVSFTIPASMTQGTNLSTDSYLSVEWTGGTACTAASFIDNATPLTVPADSVYHFDVATALGAAAGNRYEEIVYALDDCYALRYFIHSGAIENYEPGAVTAFDRVQLLKIFDAMRKTFVEDKKG